MIALLEIEMNIKDIESKLLDKLKRIKVLKCRVVAEIKLIEERNSKYQNTYDSFLHKFGKNAGSKSISRIISRNKKRIKSMDEVLACINNEQEKTGLIVQKINTCKNSVYRNSKYKSQSFVIEILEDYFNLMMIDFKYEVKLKELTW